MSPGAAPVSGAGIVTRLQEVTPGTHLIEMSLEEPVPVAPPMPGQFYMVDCFDGPGGKEHVLRRPLSLHGVPSWLQGLKSLLFLVEVVGSGSSSLCSLGTGSRVPLLGPLGLPFSIDEPPVLLVAGGMGIAPLFFAASMMDARGIGYELMAGFSSASSAYPGLGGLKGTVELWTDDGSEGNAGLVSEGVARKIKGSTFKSCLACGPEAMMAHAASDCEEAGLPCQVSLVSRMACGIGACRGCVRESRESGNICVCSDGPVFDSRQVAFHGSEG